MLAINVDKLSRNNNLSFDLAQGTAGLAKKLDELTRGRSTMTLGDKRISAALATFEFLPAEKGTDLIFTHQAAFFEGADGPQMREQGWRRLFEQLSREV